MNALGTAIVWCMIQVTLFGMLVGLLYLASRRQDPRWRALILLIGVLGVVLLTAMIASPWPDWTSVMERSVGNETTNIVAPLAESPARQNELAPTTEGVRRNLEIRESSVWAAAMRAAWNELRQPSNSFELAAMWSWRTVAFLVVAAIVLMGLARLAGGIFGVAMLRRNTIAVNEPRLTELVDVLRAELECTRPILLGECRNLATAATVGWRRPMILLPVNWRTWTPAELRSVLAHEIAHVCRADFATHLVAQIGLALHFYHPVVHWLVRRLRLEQELAADAVAARVAGGQQSYLTSLAGLALAQPSVRLGWPVQAFLPTRGTLLRRIEMLRDRRSSDFGNQRGVGVLGWLALSLLVAAGIAAAGLRAPSVAVAQAAHPEPTGAEGIEEASTQAEAASEAHFKAYEQSPSSLIAFGFRPAEIFHDERWQPVTQIAGDLMKSNLPGLSLNDIEQITFVHYRAGEPTPENPMPIFSKSTVIRVLPSIDLSKRKILPAYTETLPDGIHARPMPGGDAARTYGYVIRDNRTIVLDSVAELNKQNADPTKAPWVNSTSGSAVFLYARPEIFQEEIEAAKKNPAMAPFLAFAPLWQQTNDVRLVIDVQDPVTLRAVAACKSPAGAEQVEKTLQAVRTLIQNALDQKWAEASGQVPPNQAAIVEEMVKAAKEMLSTAQVSRQESEVSLVISSKVDLALKLSFLLPAIHAARDAAQRSQGLNNLKQIALAMHLYADTKKTFPPAVLYGPDGKTHHSWRVALLPFLEQEVLYNQYNLDEPWDSPSNLKVLAQMPAVYRHPKDSPDSTNTSYFVLTGPETVFPIRTDEAARKNFGSGFRIITDGTSNTILAVEAKRDILWTKPEDIPYSADAPLPDLGGWSMGLINAAWCDGSVRTFRKDVNEAALRANITKAGKEVGHNIP